MLDFGQNLKMLRNKKGITQKELAKNIEASERAIQNYEAGIRKPTYEILISLADYLNVSTDYLTGRTDNPKINK